VKIRLIDWRLAFPNLFKATAPQGGGEIAFSASFIAPPTRMKVTKFVAKGQPYAATTIDAVLLAVANEKWGAKGPAMLKALKAADKICLHNGDSKADYEGFPGNMFISARSKVRPSTMDGQKNEIGEQDGLLLSGYYVDAVLDIWAQENSFGKRINAQLKGVQFRRKGDVFSGGGAPAEDDDFDEISVEGDEPAIDEEVDIES
jgi:hypothetical protein